MKLVYTKTGTEVKVGDVVEIAHGQKVKVTYFCEPHKPSSSGKVSVQYFGYPEGEGTMEYFVNVIGAEWIEREDRQDG